MLCETLPGTGGSDGYYTFYPTDRAGEILFVANDRAELFSAATAGAATLDAFHEIEASAEEMSGERLLMSGRAEFSDTQDSPATVTMRRSVARLDLEVRERGVEAETLACGTGIAAAGAYAYLFRGAKKSRRVICAGGDVLTVEINAEDGELKEIFLSGPAEIAFSGKMDLK